MFRGAIEHALLETTTNFDCEASCVTEVERLICDPMKRYSEWIGKELKLAFKYNSQPNVSTAVSTPHTSKSNKPRLARRDCLVHCYNPKNSNNSLLLLFGECKPKISQAGECHEQVLKNCGLFETKYYGKIPFVLCFEMSKNILKFFIHFRGSTLLVYNKSYCKK